MPIPATTKAAMPYPIHFSVRRNDPALSAIEAFACVAGSQSSVGAGTYFVAGAWTAALIRKPVSVDTLLGYAATHLDQVVPAIWQPLRANRRMRLDAVTAGR